MPDKSESKNEAIRVGIDFGTTHTIVSLVDEGKYPILTLPFDYRGETLFCDHTPTRVALHQDRIYFGPAATRCFVEHYREGAVMLSSFKRHLQDWYLGKEIDAGQGAIAVTDLVTGFLREIKRAILRALELDDALIEAVIAVPANASSSQRFATLYCFKEAGFQVLRILDEPCASGIQFVRERYKRWDRVEADVIIYDLGGGTFDTTFLSIRRGEFDPVLSMGISRLGGDDFDEILLDLVQREVGRTFSGVERMEMLQVVRQTKENIGPYTQKLHVDTTYGLATLAVKTFYEAARPLMDRTIELVDRVLGESAGKYADPDRIVLVGGGSLLPLAPRMIRERFGRTKLHHGLYPFASVAIGAAIQAGSPEIEVLDRLTRHFGVVRVKEPTEDYVDVIFEKGLPLPGPGEILTVDKPGYDPRFNIGSFQYLECGELDPATGQVRDEPILWNRILFPFDRNLNPEGQPPPNIEAMPIEPTDRLMDERIAEEYILDEFGIITAKISRSVRDRYSSYHNLFRRT